MLDTSNIRKKSVKRPWYNPALDLIKDFPKESDVLDLGCGLGEFSLILRKRGFKVYCADGSKKYVNLIRKKGFKACCVDFNSKLPFKSNSFDLVVSLEVIEHIEKAEYFISEIYRILKPKGYLLISTPNIAYFGLRLRGLFGLPPPDEGYHFRFFTFNSLKKLLINNKFKIIKNNSITFIHGLHKILRTNPVVVKTPLLHNIFSIKIIILAKKQNKK